MAHLDDATIIATTHNTARYFTEQRQVSWVCLIGTVLWGIVGYFSMPQRKDPDIPVIIALAICRWPGIDAVRIEDRIVRRMEATVAENSHVETIRSTVRTGIAFVYVELKEGTTGTGEFSTTSPSSSPLSETCPRERAPFSSSRTSAVPRHSCSRSPARDWMRYRSHFAPTRCSRPSNMSGPALDPASAPR